MIDLCFVCSKSLFEEEKNLSITTNGDSSRHMTTVQIVWQSCLKKKRTFVDFWEYPTNTYFLNLLWDTIIQEFF